MPSMTKQSFKGECDMENILARFRSTGLLPQGKTPVYGDEPADWQSTQFALAEAQSLFEQLPRDIRTKYQTIGGIFDALQDEHRLHEMEAEGILSAFNINIPPTTQNAAHGDSEKTQTPTHHADNAEGMGESPSEASKSGATKND